MKQKHIMALVQENMTTVSVIFEGMKNQDLLVINTKSEARKFTYKVHRSDDIKVDDLVVVYLREQIRIGRVTDVHEEPDIDIDSDINYKWIVQKVDLSEYNNRVEKENEFLKQLAAIERKKAKSQLLADFTSMYDGDAQPLLEDAFNSIKTL